MSKRSLLCAATVASACLVGALRLAGRIVLSDVANVCGVEPNVVYTVEKVLCGLPAYTRTNEIPFDITQYGPLYYYLAAGLARLAGVSPGEVREVTMLARLTSSVFSLGILAVMFLLLARTLRVGPSLALIASAAAYVCHTPWHFLARPDALASFCTLCGVYCAVGGLASERASRRSDASVCLAAGFGILALLTKQNGLQLPAILLSFFLITRDWRRLTLSTCASIVVLAPASVLLWLSFGPALKENVVDGVRNGLDVQGAVANVFGPFFLELNMAVIVAGCVVALAAWFRPGARSSEKFLGYSVLFTFVFATVTALKMGSAAHYYNDFIVLACVSLACFLNRRYGVCAKTGDGARPLEWVVAVFVVLWLPNLVLSHMERYPGAHSLIASRKPVARTVSAALEPYPDAFFFTNDTTLANFLPDRAVVPHHFLSAIAHVCGVVDYAPLEDCLKTGRVRLCVVGKGQNPRRQLGFLGVKADCFTLMRYDGAYSLWQYDKSTEGDGRASADP